VIVRGEQRLSMSFPLETTRESGSMFPKRHSLQSVSDKVQISTVDRFPDPHNMPQ
jgi:hypothetical protein